MNDQFYNFAFDDIFNKNEMYFIDNQKIWAQ